MCGRPLIILISVMVLVGDAVEYCAEPELSGSGKEKEAGYEEVGCGKEKQSV